MKNRTRTRPLPSGQRLGAAFPRFGAGWRPVPEVPTEPRLLITGEVEESGEIGLDALESLPRREQACDLHCVTTWTKPDLRWSGWRLSDVYEQVLVPRFRPRPEARYLVLFGLDGYCCSLLIEDALADDVMLADVLDGEPLSPAHGAPLRVVSPRQYGYKSLKHLSGFALRRHPVRLPFGLEHRRGRVDLEERHAFLPAWLVRLPYRALIGPTVYLNRRCLTSQHFVGRPTLLHQLMPHAVQHEVHDMWVDAAPTEAFQALAELTPREVRLLRPLMALRQLPAWLAGRRTQVDHGSPLLQGLLQGGFVRLAEEPGREIVLGVVGRFWKLSRNAPLATIRDRESFVAFEDPGYAKVAMSFLIRAEGKGSRVITETRIRATDRAATRSFLRYWRLVRLGSGLIRRSWLAAVRRRLAHRQSEGAQPEIG